MPERDRSTDAAHDFSIAWQWLFIGFAVGAVLLSVGQGATQTLVTTFLAITLEALPFMLIGALVSGFVEVFVPRERVVALLPARRWYSVLIAGGLGLVFPVCECAVVVVVRRLLRKGAPLEAGIAFLLAGPIVNPLVTASTAVAYNYDWNIVLARLGYGYGVAVIVGMLVGMFFSRRQAIADEASLTGGGSPGGSPGGRQRDASPSPLTPLPEGEGDGGHAHDKDHGFAHHYHHHGFFGKAAHALQHASLDFFDVARFLVVGAFFAALLQQLIPQEVFTTESGSATASSIFLMMLLAMLLNLCSEADAFVAASFQSIGVPLASQLAFMVLGPMLDIKLLLMYTRLFRPLAIVAIAGLTFLAVFLAMWSLGVVPGPASLPSPAARG